MHVKIKGSPVHFKIIEARYNCFFKYNLNILLFVKCRGRRALIH